MIGFYLPLILVLPYIFYCQGNNDTEIDPTMIEMNDQEIHATYGELNYGKHYFEGDILLTQHQKDTIEASWKKSGLETRALIKDARKLWANKVVPFLIADDINDDSRGFIKSAIKEWETKTCVKFIDRTSEEDYIEFVYEEGCSSYVGRIGGRQTISVGNSDGSIVCKHGNIVHEVAHSLGFFHEHSRPDRDDFVSVLWDNVEDGYERNFYRETLKTVDSLSVGYDYDSVMHYGEFFFTKLKGLRTIAPKQTGASIGQRVGLSEKDTLQGNLLYKCSGFKEKATITNTSSVSIDQGIWGSIRPLRDKEVWVLRNKVQKGNKTRRMEDRRHPQRGKEMSSAKRDNSAHGKGSKAGLLRNVLKTKKGNRKLQQSAKKSSRIKYGKSRSTVLSGNEAKMAPSRPQFSPDDADLLEGDNDEGDMLLTSGVAGVTTQADLSSSPTQLATDRATLAQEEEDAMQQQDSNDTGEENLGKGYFEGDMIMSPEQQAFLDQMKEGDEAGDGTKRALIRDNTYLWPNASVYYDFHKGVDRIGRRRARAAMRHWQKHTCLKFKRVTQPPEDLGYIEFVFEGGCASRVGRGGPQMQKLTIGSTELRCKVGNIIHELGHAVGFFHEHSRPDRNEYVRVLKKNILPGYERNFYRFSRKWIDSRDVPYDYGSIMHYNRAFFSRFPFMLDTIVPLQRNVDIGQRKALSKFDVLQANLLYQCDGRKRLTEDEIKKLQEESADQILGSEAFCVDVYDNVSCQSVRTMGYCEKFPITMRTTCGITCNLCGMRNNKKTGVETPAKLPKKVKSEINVG